MLAPFAARFFVIAAPIPKGRVSDLHRMAVDSYLMRLTSEGACDHSQLSFQQASRRCRRCLCHFGNVQVKWSIEKEEYRDGY